MEYLADKFIIQMQGRRTKPQRMGLFFHQNKNKLTKKSPPLKGFFISSLRIKPQRKSPIQRGLRR